MIESINHYKRTEPMPRNVGCKLDLATWLVLRNQCRQEKISVTAFLKRAVLAELKRVAK